MEQSRVIRETENYKNAIHFLSGLPPYCEDCEYHLTECNGWSECKVQEAKSVAIKAIKQVMNLNKT